MMPTSSERASCGCLIDGGGMVLHDYDGPCARHDEDSLAQWQRTLLAVEQFGLALAKAMTDVIERQNWPRRPDPPAP